jgi:DNA-binding MarR family transcriptional regulator
LKKPATEEVGTLGALLRLPYEALTRRVYGALAERGYSDIRPAHSAVFRHILPDGSRATDMAERAHMTKQSMAYLVEYLAERGYVTFVPDPADGRAKLVRLTDRGQAVLETLLAISRDAEADVARRLGADDLSRLRTLLVSLREAVDPPARPRSAGR